MRGVASSHRPHKKYSFMTDIYAVVLTNITRLTKSCCFIFKCRIRSGFGGPAGQADIAGRVSSCCSGGA